MAGGTLHAGMPLLVVWPPRSSEGLVNELLIWLHSALMLSASAATDRSISGTGGEDQWTGSVYTKQTSCTGTTQSAYMPERNKIIVSSRACGIGLGRMDGCLN